MHVIRRAAAGLVLSLLVVAACDSASATAVGVVIGVEARSLVEIDQFTLRTEDGTLMTLIVGQLELDSGAFPASHLQEHLATAMPIVVAYRAEPEGNVAYRLVDAPWAQP